VIHTDQLFYERGVTTHNWPVRQRRSQWWNIWSSTKAPTWPPLPRWSTMIFPESSVVWWLKKPFEQPSGLQALHCRLSDMPPFPNHRLTNLLSVMCESLLVGEGAWHFLSTISGRTNN
jgi:hypothetical protein